MKLSHYVPVFSTILALALAPIAAAADNDGEKPLAVADAALTNQSHTFTFEVVSDGKTMALDVKIKGAKQLFSFTAPADMKGTKLLVLSATEAYVYLPAFGKIRRVASHTTSQGYMGLAFSQDDLAMQIHPALYDHTVSGDDSVLLLPKPGETPPFSKIEMTIEAKSKLPSELRYFDANGKLAKTETRSGYTCEGDVCTPGTRKMVDHANNLTTTLVRKSWKLNPTLSDDLFSKRNLER